VKGEKSNGGFFSGAAMGNALLFDASSVGPEHALRWVYVSLLTRDAWRVGNVAATLAALGRLPVVIGFVVGQRFCEDNRFHRAAQQAEVGVRRLRFRGG